MLSIILTLLIPILVLMAMVGDARQMEISNRLNAAMLCLGVVLVFLKDQSATLLIWHSATAAAMFAAGYILFLARSMGGGDVKMLTALAMIFGPTLSLHLVFWMCLFGGLLTLSILLFRRYPLPVRWSQSKAWQRIHDPASGIPYGLAIGAAALKVWWGTIEAKNMLQTALNFF